MNNDRWQRAKEIFAAALEQPAEQREAFIRRQCANDDALLDEVLSLLAAHQTRDNEPTTVRSNPRDERLGARIGPYKLLELIGEGGFGSVYMAQQEQPVRRRVALKILKPGMDSRMVIARFEAERQALALMDHPHIARVFDGGVVEAGGADIPPTIAGRPYFVMEYVKGDPLTEFADAHKLSVRARLDLFMQVCQAVQHAHTKGIIHRDIKPRNVLANMTDGKPFARVIDFGIAKATGAALTDKTLFTEHRQLLGTPEYMSPEQVEGSVDIDTRTDVYALGVLLYELLTGNTPHDARRLRSAVFAEMQRIIKEEEPPAPSVRLGRELGAIAQTAVARQAEPAALSRLVRGELDWIVMKALDKDRARRYETANQFAEDVQRHLSGEPVVAAPPTMGYRIRKFVRKHRVAVVTTSLVGAALVLGIIGTTWGRRWALRERDRAEIEAQRAVAAQTAERDARDRAEAAERRALENAETIRHSAYAQTIQQAYAWTQNSDGARAWELLEKTDPDLRGWEWDFVRYRADNSILTLEGHMAAISAVAISPDDRQIVSADENGGLRFWELRTGRSVHICREAGSPIRVFWYSPDGQRLAAGDDAGEVTVWDTATGRLSAMLRGHEGRVTGVAFTSDDELVSAGADGTLRRWTGEPLAEAQRVQAHNGGIASLDFDPTRRLLVTSGADSLLAVWRTAPLMQHRSMPNRGASVRKAAFSNRDLYNRGATAMYGGSREDAAGGWAVACFENETIFAISGDRNASAEVRGENAIAVSDEFDYFEASSPEGSVRVLSLSSDGRWLAAGTFAGRVRLWDQSAREEWFKGMFATFIDSKTVLSVSPNGVAAVCDRNRMRGRSSKVGFALTNLIDSRDYDPTSWVDRIAYLPSERRLAYVDCDGLIREYDVDSGKETGLAPINAAQPAPRAVAPISRSADGRRLACGAQAGGLAVWDMHSRQLLRVIDTPFSVCTLQLGPTGDRIAFADTTGLLGIAEVQTGRLIAQRQVHAARANCVAFSSSGSRLLTVGEDGRACLLDSGTLQELRRYETIWPLSVSAFSPDESRYYVAGEASLFVYSDFAETPLIECQTYCNLNCRVASIDIAPDGSSLLTAAYDSSASVLAVYPPSERDRDERHLWAHAMRCYKQLPLDTKLAQSLPLDPNLRPELRDAIRSIHDETERPNAYELDSYGRAIAHKPNQSPERYASALRAAQSACDVAKDNPNFLTTLGMAQFRNGRHEGALATLARADELYRAAFEGNVVAVAFISMAHAKLGHSNEARATLARLRAMPSSSLTGEAIDAIKEAESLIDPPPASAPATAPAATQPSEPPGSSPAPP